MKGTNLPKMGLVLAAFVVVLAVGACGSDPTATPRPTATPTATATPLPPGVTPTATPRPTATPTAAPISFAGKTIRITVGFAPGGGFDTFARVFAAHLRNALPGNPNVIVANLPGANTLVAAKSVINKQYNPDAPDIVLVIATLIQDAVLNGSEDFDPKDLAFLGVPDFAPSDQTYCIRTSVASSLDEFLNAGRDFTLAQLGQLDLYATTTKWGTNLGFPLELIFGYSGTSDMNAAFNRGEVEVTATCRQSEVLLNPEWAEGYATPLFYTSVEPQWVKDGKAQGKWSWVKPMAEIGVEHFGATQTEVDGLNALLDISASTRVFAMPRQTPPDVVAAVRDAFGVVALSDAFIADMKDRGFDVGYLSGADYEELVNGLTSLPEETLNVVRATFPQN